MASDPFADLARELPDGAFWVTGAWLKRVFAALTADRVRAGDNLDEHPSDKGRFFNAKAGGTTTAATIPPLTVVDASEPDAGGGTAFPGRVRVYNGFLGGLLPAEMKIPDAVLPDGTDNHCYLTMQPGPNYVYGKVLIDASSGLFSAAHVYSVTSTEETDGTYAYLPLAGVSLSGNTLEISQFAAGNQSLLVYCSADGTSLQPVWQTQ